MTHKNSDSDHQNDFFWPNIGIWHSVQYNDIIFPCNSDHHHHQYSSSLKSTLCMLLLNSHILLRVWLDHWVSWLLHNKLFEKSCLTVVMHKTRRLPYHPWAVVQTLPSSCQIITNNNAKSWGCKLWKWPIFHTVLLYKTPQASNNLSFGARWRLS